MNVMSGRIRQILADETAQAEALRREVFVDPLTGLYNRRSFRRQLQSLSKSQSDVFGGALALLEIGRFGEFNQRAGFRRGDELLGLIAGALTRALEGRASVCGRLSGAGFAFALANVDAVALQRLVADACRCEGEMPEFSTLLSAADHALQRARQGGQPA